MSPFESWSDFGTFADYVRRESRHLLDEKGSRFVKAVMNTCPKRLRTIRKGTLLWRSQLGNEWKADKTYGGKVAMPHRASRMIPLPDRATEGRVNPKGIPCLYLSTDPETAMSEVRPWIGSRLTIAQFRILRLLRLVDCSSDMQPSLFGADPKTWEGAVWAGINSAFSQPVTPSDEVAAYAPTQVLAEAFRHGGYDGVMYRSLLGKGSNIAVFNPKLAQVGTRFMFEVSSVHFDFSKVPYPLKMLKANESRQRRSR